MIQNYIYENYSLKAHTSYIAEVKRKHGIEIDMYIIVSYGVRITEVVSEVQKKVKYVLEKTLNMKFNYINVYVQNVKNI